VAKEWSYQDDTIRCDYRWCLNFGIFESGFCSADCREQETFELKKDIEKAADKLKKLGIV
jgi:hypothetical protein